ncbi:MAG: FKBP-type peptidyl-prolyl cis-trans isomerase [Gammaproteobacteria bacterium]
MSDAITEGSRVTAHLRITLGDGTVAESTFESDPLALTIGRGDIHPNLERLFLGLRAGERRTFDLVAEKAFGVPRMDLVQRLPVSQFPSNLPPAKGQVVEFASPDGEPVAGTILKIEGQQVTVDFNPPLAGRDLQIELEVLAVDPDT